MTLKPKRKILKVSVLAPDLAGGGTTRVFLVARVFQKLNYQVKILGCQFGEQIYPEPPADIPVYSIPGLNYPQMLDSSHKMLDEIDGDLVCAIKPRPTSFGIALLNKLIKQKPVLLDIDDWEMSWEGGDAWKYRPSFRQLGRDILKTEGELRKPNHRFYLQKMEKLVKFANAITVDTKFLQNRFGGTYLPNGKDTSLFDPAQYNAEVSRARYGLSEYRVLMFPGTARPHKGLEDVLQALDILNQPDFRLVIVGGRKPDNYEDQLMEQWGRWIIKLPRFPLDAMPEVVAAAHLIVVPQRDTPIAVAQCPLKLSDGMAMAKPILSTKVGDIPEMLGDTGYLVDSHSPEKIAEQIQWIFEHLNEANERGMRARKRCIEYYSLEAMSAILSEAIAGL
ncbi:glycosyltransferase family 4 protein [Oscillatoria sp. HE19RPO]|uniref:glycosyltransferase family 4 protein n=1 Tax=Oscillatoria sp. HE19RPO TaxID=2954806 RepID=UPI0020C48C14|nr:glycosyltransferase family 4 protein [Oscillatoria sp. HE19RPO]